MKKKESYNSSFIGGFYIFSALILIITIITGSYKTDTTSTALNKNLWRLPQLPLRISLIIIFLIMGYGLIKLYKWAFILVLIYCLCFIIANFFVSLNIGNKEFYSNVVFSVWVLITLPHEMKLFNSNSSSS